LAKNSGAVQSILADLNDSTNGESEVTIEELMRSISYRGYGPLLLIPALLEISPLGAVPAVPTILATTVVIFAVQILLGRKHLWLPSFMGRKTLSSERMERAVDKLQPIARWLDKWFHGRLPALSGTNATRAAAVCCILLALTVPPLELLPFASTAPMVAIAMFGLALIVNDGLLMMAGFILTAAALTVGIVLAA
jgi:hypothetical protein